MTYTNHYRDYTRRYAPSGVAAFRMVPRRNTTHRILLGDFAKLLVAAPLKALLRGASYRNITHRFYKIISLRQFCQNSERQLDASLRIARPRMTSQRTN